MVAGEVYWWRMMMWVLLVWRVEITCTFPLTGSKIDGSVRIDASSLVID